MPVTGPSKIRSALLAGVVAVGLAGAGTAIAWSADSPFPTPSPSASQPAPGQESAPGQQKKQDKPAKAQRGQLQHSESVVKKADGTFVTILEQRGTVEAVSDTSITVKSEDGFSKSYTVNADTKVTKAPATGDDGKRLRPTDGTIADITAGEVVRISGVKDGGSATATRIAEGAGDVPGLGLGRGHGFGKGHGHGHGKGLSDQAS